MPGFERFSQTARNVLRRAQDEALRRNHNYIGGEHLLLGLIEEGKTALAILRNLGVEPQKVKAAVDFVVGRGERTVSQDIGLTPGAKQAIQFAINDAQRVGRSLVGDGNLLIGLIQEDDGVAAGVLKSLGVTLENARAQMNRIGQTFESVQSQSTGKPTPTLDQFSTDLTLLARDGKLDPLIGREKEISRVIQVLSRRTKNNPVLVGEPGVGKTAIAEGLAQRLVANDGTLVALQGKRLISLDLGAMVAGTMYRGEFEARVKKVVDEVRAAGNCILFIDELHTLLGAGAAIGGIDASSMLKPLLAKGELQVVGATTLDDWRKHIERDKALARRFQPIQVDEPTVEETIAILRGLKAKYEEYHKLTISDEAISAAAHLSARYIQDRFLPDKAIDLIDEAAAKVRMTSRPVSFTVKELEYMLEVLKKEESQAIKDRDYGYASQLLEQKGNLQEKLSLLVKEAGANPEISEGNVVDEESVASVVSMWTGIPVTRLTVSESQRLLQMEAILRQKVVGQEEAVAQVSKAIRRARAGLKDPRRPIGVFMALGPTGVGKTHLVRKLAEFLYGNEDAMVRLDMSEFMEKHAVARLVGAPPGYVGYDDGGQLTEAVRRKSYCVILLDEIEKAHPDVFNILLQIFDDGHLTDARGRKVNFRNTIVVMTSNLGSDVLRKSANIGFTQGASESSSYEAMKEKMLGEVKRFFRPEFLNRIDGTVVFHSLTKAHIVEIVGLMIKEVAVNLNEKQINIEVTERATEFLATKGYDPAFGARPLRRTIQTEIEDRLSEYLLQGSLTPGDTVVVDCKDNAIVFNTVSKLKDFVSEIASE